MSGARRLLLFPSWQSINKPVPGDFSIIVHIPTLSVNITSYVWVYDYPENNNGVNGKNVK